jgi:hypothetical protein
MSIAKLTRERVALLTIGISIGFLVSALVNTCWSDPLSSQATGGQKGNSGTVAGTHDFDFLLGRWNVHHHRLNGRLKNSHEWSDFEGTLINSKVMGGLGNIDDNLIGAPNHPYRALAIRAFDEKNHQWSIWWLDGRTPSAALEPPVHGGFAEGVGLFYADDSLDGRAIRVRYTWSHITANSCDWEQAFSADGGRTWELNWVMQLTRAPQTGQM